MVIPQGPGSLLIFGGIPHYLQKVEPERKLVLKRHYRCVKRWFTGCSIAGVGALDGYGLGKDMIRSELKSRSDKTIGLVILGPIIQGFSIPFYIITSTLKIQRYAVAIAEIGALVMRTQASVAGWSFLILDLSIFGEVVPMFEGNELMIYHNDTSQAIMSIAEDEFGLMNEVASSIIPEVSKNVTEVLSTTTDVLSCSDNLISTVNSFTNEMIGEDFN